MGKPTINLLVACRPEDEAPVIQKALQRSSAAIFQLTFTSSLTELRMHLKAGWDGLLLLSEQFSRKPLRELISDFANRYTMPPILLLLNDSTPGHRSIAYDEACYAWFILDDFRSKGIGKFIAAVDNRAEQDHASYEEIAAYQAILANLGNGVGIVDRNGLLAYANQALSNIIGIPAKEMIGQSSAAFLPAETRERVWKQFQYSKSGETSSIEVSLKTPKGEERKLDLTVTPRFTGKGDFDGLAFVAHDITALARSRQLTQAQLELSKQLSSTNDALHALTSALLVSMQVGEYSTGAVYRKDPHEGFILVKQEKLDIAPLEIRAGKRLEKLLAEGGILRSVDQHSCPAELEPFCTMNSIMVPIRQGEQALAFIILSGTPLHSLKEDQITVLSSIGSMVANSLGRISADEYRRRTAQYLHGVVNSQDDMVVRIDKDGRYTFANDAFCRNFNKSRDKLIGNRFIPRIHPEDYRRTIKAFAQARRSPYRVSIQNRVRMQGEWRWLSWENSAILNERGEVVEYQGVCRDTTDQINTQRALEISESKLRAIFNNTLQAFVLFDTDTKILALNRLAQWDREQTLGQPMKEGVPILEYALPEEVERFSDAVRRVLNGETMKYESRTVFLSGEIRWFEIHLIPVHDDHGRITGGLLTTIDINDRKLVQQAVERSEQRFRSLVQNSTDLISIFTPEVELIYQTVSVERVLGYGLDELLGRSIFDLIHIEDLDEVVNRFQEVLRNPESTVPFEFRIKHKEGHWVYLESLASNRVNDPNVQGVVLTSRDISERRRSEQQLRLLATAIGNAEEAVVITDAELEEPGPRIVFVNEGFSRISGYAPREVLGKTPRILQGPKTNRKLLDRLKSELSDGKSFSAETVNYRKDGSEYTVEWRISPVFDASGRVTHYVSIQRDITDRKRAEEEIRKTAEELAQRNDQLELAKQEAEQSRVAVEHAAEELRRAYEDAAVARKIAEEANEAKSQFLANMSHEIRTPLTAILGFARLLNDQSSEHDEMRGFTGQILSAGEHLLSLINDILDLSRVEAGRMTIEPELVNISKLGHEVADLYRPLAEKKSLRLDLQLGDLPPSALLDRGRIRQVMTNLVGNAIKFTDEGEVSVCIEPMKRRNGIRITVKDSGPGIPSEQQSRIYEPFYQGYEAHRPKKEGTGLGLAITMRIVQAMSGSIDLKSEPGTGTTFTVEVPCEFVETPLEAKEQITGDLHPTASQQHLRILVADDHAPNRTLIRHILTSRGHEVVLAEDGVQAVNEYMKQAFDILVLDVQMPNMDGHTAIRKIRATPGGDRVPILTLTAYAMRGDRERSIAAGADDYVSKPFDPSKLADKIEQLARSQGAGPAKKSSDPEMDALRLEYLEDLHQKFLGLLDKELDSEELKIWGHRVAGSGGTFGFPELTTLGRKLEHEAKHPSEESEPVMRQLLEQMQVIVVEELKRLSSENGE